MLPLSALASWAIAAAGAACAAAALGLDVRPLLAVGGVGGIVMGLGAQRRGRWGGRGGVCSATCDATHSSRPSKPSPARSPAPIPKRDGQHGVWRQSACVPPFYRGGEGGHFHCIRAARCRRVGCVGLGLAVGVGGGGTRCMDVTMHVHFGQTHPCFCPPPLAAWWSGWTRCARRFATTTRCPTPSPTRWAGVVDGREGAVEESLRAGGSGARAVRARPAADGHCALERTKKDSDVDDQSAGPGGLHRGQRVTCLPLTLDG